MASSNQPPNNGNNDNFGGRGEDPYKWKEELPIGTKFRPTDQVLILKYLLHKFTGRPIVPGIVSDEEVYDYPPELLQGRAFKHDDGRMYFFTYLKRKENSIKKSDRLVKEVGYWKATQKRIAIQRIPGVDETVIGTKTPLAYHKYVIHQNGEKVGRKQNWLMNEYRLRFNTSQDRELALCVVYYHEQPKKKLPSEE